MTQFMNSLLESKKSLHLEYQTQQTRKNRAPQSKSLHLLAPTHAQNKIYQLTTMPRYTKLPVSPPTSSFLNMNRIRIQSFEETCNTEEKNQGKEKKMSLEEPK